MNRRHFVEHAEDPRIEPTAEVNAISHEVIGAAIEVHRLRGAGFLESIYEEALCVELTLRGLRFDRQVPIGVQYKGHDVGEARLDLLVERSLVVELKAVGILAPIHVAQVISYLKATQHRLGLLITFNTAVLRRGVRRVVCT
jgi:GxxExxY protein